MNKIISENYFIAATTSCKFNFHDYYEGGWIAGNVLNFLMSFNLKKIFEIFLKFYLNFITQP